VFVPVVSDVCSFAAIAAFVFSPTFLGEIPVLFDFVAVECII
jgi:hypothetical protein